MQCKGKAAAHGGSSGRKVVGNSTRSTYRNLPKFASPRPGETAIYLGMEYLGRVGPVRGQFQARDAADRLLNTLLTPKDATSAVYAAGGAR